MAAPQTVVNIAAELATFSDYWAPRTVAEFNGLHIKVVKVHGEFNWHDHPETDEVFLVMCGAVTIELEDRPDVTLGEGEMFVVPRGLRHRPVAEEPCELVLIEPAGIPNTGDTATAAPDVWA